MATANGRAEVPEIDIPLVGLTKGITVKVSVKGFRRWHLRLRLGIWLMRFAVWVSGMGCEVGDIDLPEPPDPNRPSDKELRKMMEPRFIGGKERGDAPQG